MNTVKEFFKSLGEKKPIIAIACRAFVRGVAVTGGALAVAFLLLWCTGVYDNVATALDLKYNSNWLLVPMWSALAVFALCLVVGLLMYFHKYKRPKDKSDFSEALAPVLGQETR